MTARVLQPLFSIGHSNRSAEEFLGLLRAHGVRHVADVRAQPQSRRNPQFGRDALERTLSASGIGYTHLPALGGKRAPRPDSENDAITDPALRGYADHLASAEFAAGLAALLEIAAHARAAFMCAEADPRECHRWLLSDTLFARGVTVRHIRDSDRTPDHALSREAVVRIEHVTYPAAQRELPGLL